MVRMMLPSTLCSQLVVSDMCHPQSKRWSHVEEKVRRRKKIDTNTRKGVGNRDNTYTHRHTGTRKDRHTNTRWRITDTQVDRHPHAQAENGRTRNSKVHGSHWEKKENRVCSGAAGHMSVWCCSWQLLPEGWCSGPQTRRLLNTCPPEGGSKRPAVYLSLRINTNIRKKNASVSFALSSLSFFFCWIFPFHVYLFHLSRVLSSLSFPLHSPSFHFVSLTVTLPLLYFFLSLFDHGILLQDCMWHSKFFPVDHLSGMGTWLPKGRKVKQRVRDIKLASRKVRSLPHHPHLHPHPPSQRH